MEATYIWDHVIVISVWPAPSKYTIHACWMNKHFGCHPAFLVTGIILHLLPNEHWRLKWVLVFCKSLSTLTLSFWIKTLTWALDLVFNESGRLLKVFSHLISIFSLPGLTWQTCVILLISRDNFFFQSRDICIYCQLIRLTSETN